ncbi:DUF4230 domain-containing protein [Pannus brasiliensis CCIBt3594]|uniref:DUF4230 domain-containing protein n=1 Tax=Pannus brasiliensis CCIBt3594 TaxID=1427578 RepID=A0AAW9QXX9_9CHRO
MLKEKTSLPLFRYFALTGQIGIGIVSIALIFGVWKTLDRVASFFAPAVPKVEVSSIIVDRVRALSELTTASFVMEAIVPTSKAQKVGNFVLAETKLLYIANGEVKAGINLEKITPDSVTVEGDRIRIQLPPPEILDSKIDVTRSRVYDYNRGFLGLGPDVAPELQTLAQKETLAKILTTACERGILQEANEKAKLSLTRIFQTSGYQQVEVIVSEPEKCSPS